MRVVDSQWHWYPRLLWEAYVGNEEYPRCRRDGDGYAFELAPDRWFPIPKIFLDLEEQFEVADAAGIDAIVSSSASFGDVDGLPVEQAKEVAHALNEERAAAERQFAGRFYGVATIPWQDTDAAVEVLNDAVGRLNMRAVLVHSNIAGSPIDAEERRPIYARIEELGVPLFIHPARTIMEEKVRRYGLEYILAYMFDTSIAALSLVLAEITTQFPALEIVHPHCGATLPYLAGRIDSSYDKPYALGHEWERKPSEHLAAFYTDTMCQSERTLAFATEFYSLDHVMFGSDFPYFSPATELAFVRGAVGDGEAAEKILHGNVERLLGLDRRD